MQANLIAGISLTHLTVFDQRPAPDGIHSDCAQCAREAYLSQ